MDILEKLKTMMNNVRYQAEIAVLRKKLPSGWFHFEDRENSTPVLKAAARTNGGNVYTLYFDLDGFPMQAPKVFVMKMLRTKDGLMMSDPSSAMHTLSSEHGWTRICHYGSQSWTPNVSLYKVYIKCRLWLEMYELHLKTGKPIDYYLSHQQ